MISPREWLYMHMYIYMCVCVAWYVHMIVCVCVVWYVHMIDNTESSYLYGVFKASELEFHVTDLFDMNINTIVYLRGFRQHNCQIAKFMGPTWGPSGSCWPRWAPCWPGPMNLVIRKMLVWKDSRTSQLMDRDISGHCYCDVKIRNCA